MKIVGALHEAVERAWKALRPDALHGVNIHALASSFSRQPALDVTDRNHVAPVMGPTDQQNSHGRRNERDEDEHDPAATAAPQVGIPSGRSMNQFRAPPGIRASLVTSKPCDR